MSIKIQNHAEELTPAVREFNARLKSAGVKYQFPPKPTPRWLPKIDDRLPYMEYFLCVEDGSTVRGGYILKHQEFIVQERVVHLGFIKLPLSEGIIGKSYALLGVQMMMDAARRCPLLFGLGIGGGGAPVAGMLVKLKWQLCEVPFWFKVLRPSRFLRSIKYLRKTPARRLLLDALAYSGVGWAAIKAYQAVRTRRVSAVGSTVESVSDFGPWADELWDRCRSRYRFIAVRDSQVLNRLYRPTESKFIRLRVLMEDKVVGWAVLLNTEWDDHNFFGGVRLGSLVDCLALPEHAGLVVQAAACHLERGGADLVISNQSHAAWGRALETLGFINGPSNFIFGASPPLLKLLESLDVKEYHLNRGDGDGPINL